MGGLVAPGGSTPTGPSARRRAAEPAATRETEGEGRGRGALKVQTKKHYPCPLTALTWVIRHLD